jgi:hypothetical protein
MKINRKFLFFPVLVIAFAASSVYVLAVAEDDHDEYRPKLKPTHAQPVKGATKALERAVEKLEKFDARDFRGEDFDKFALPSSIAINPDGHTRLTNAEVTSAASNSLGVRVWGLSFTVNVGAETKIFATRNQEAAFSDIRVGHRLNVIGRTSEGTPGVIQAEVIHNRSIVSAVRDAEIARLRGLIEDLIRRLQEVLARTGQTLPPGFSPLPSPSPSPSPSPTPSPSPSPTPSPSPSPTPTP